MSNAGLVMVSGANSGPSLTSIGGEQGDDWYPGYFRTMLNDVNRGRIAAVYVYEELGISKVATINDGDAYTSGYTLGPKDKGGVQK